MTKIKVQQSFLLARKALQVTLPPTTRKRLHQVKLKFSHRYSARWVAYFDANRHLVVINLPRLTGKSESFLAMLLTHELLHAASHHHCRKSATSVELKAGFRLETYLWADHKRSRRTYHSHLNEAFVAFLTRQQTGMWDRYYLLEQLVLVALIKRLGIASFRQAFFDNGLHHFVQRLEKALGETAREEILEAFERRRFEPVQKYL